MKTLKSLSKNISGNPNLRFQSPTPFLKSFVFMNMKKVIKLTESDLINVVKKIIKENYGEMGDNPPSNLNKFINDFISNVDNSIIISMLYRMLENDKFVKFGKKIYSFTDEEKEKLEQIKPLLYSLVDTISEIRKIQKM